MMYFGLWLDENFGLGHSKAGPQCITYGSPRLSKNEEFNIDTVEVWGVGIPPETIVSGMRQLLSVCLFIFYNIDI